MRRHRAGQSPRCLAEESHGIPRGKALVIMSIKGSLEAPIFFCGRRLLSFGAHAAMPPLGEQHRFSAFLGPNMSARNSTGFYYGFGVAFFPLRAIGDNVGEVLFRSFQGRTEGIWDSGNDPAFGRNSEPTLPEREGKLRSVGRASSANRPTAPDQRAAILMLANVGPMSASSPQFC